MQSHSQRIWPIGPQYQRIDEDDATEILDDPESDVWHVQVAAGDVRVVSVETLDDLYRYDVIDQHVFVWQKGMPGWVQLESLLGPDADDQEDPFHVLLGPGIVRELTLEQLDEFYTNEIIDENTMVWQKGMTEWQSLGKVAGIGEALPSDLPTVPQQNHVARPYVAPVTSAPPVARPYVAPVTSAPPVAFTIEPPAEVAAGRPVRWPFRLALAAGVILAVLRNDLAYSVVGQTALANRYTDAEAALLGGPAFGTMRSVERLVTDCGGHLDPVRLPVAVTQYADTQKAHAAQAKPPSNAEPTPKASSSSSANASAIPVASAQVANTPTAPNPSTTASVASASTTGALPPGVTREAANDKGKTSTALTQNVAAALGGMSARPSATPKTTNARPAKKRAAGAKGSLRSNGSYFDPLNPTL